MATFLKFQPFVAQVANGVHNFSADSLVIALTNVAPSSANSQLSDLTEISYTNLSSRALTVSSSAQSGGVYKLIIDDLTLTASGGAVAPFRYVVIYNSSTSSPANALVGYYDYGSSLTLNDGDSLAINFDAAAGVISIT
jgi:hypothetical protein